MKKLYVNDKLVLVIYDSDIKVAGEEEDFVDLHDYIYETIVSNMEYDGVEYIGDFRWEKGE